MRQQTAREDSRAGAEATPLLAKEDRWSIPTSWEWRALADLVLFIDYRGQTPTTTSEGVRLVTAENVKKGVVNLSPEEFLSFDGYGRWMTAKGIKAAKLKRLPIAIPPFAEQQRIVARVHELMSICDRLEAQIAAEENVTSRLLEALLHDALESPIEAVIS